MSETVMIIAGETSGELYGALLAVSLKKTFPKVRIIGIGGDRMKNAGVELISGITSAFGLAVSSIASVRETFRKAKEALLLSKPDVLVLIDYPDFNLMLASVAKKNNIKVLYYVSPQVWAWRKGRVKKIAKLVNKMAVILPFEEKIYRNAGLDCEFVGHPVFDEMHTLTTDKNILKRELGLKEKAPLLSLLPGSRPHELNRLLPVLLDVAKTFKKEFSEFQFCIPFAPNTDINKYNYIIENLRNEGIIINKGESLKTLAASDLAVVASGTAVLQAAMLGIPLVVIYRLFPLSFWLAKLILKVKYSSLINILSGREVVKELFQSDVSTSNIMNELRKITSDEQYREKMLAAYDNVRNMFSGRNASERVTDIISKMAGWKC